MRSAAHFAPPTPGSRPHTDERGTQALAREPSRQHASASGRLNQERLARGLWESASSGKRRRDSVCCHRLAGGARDRETLERDGGHWSSGAPRAPTAPISVLPARVTRALKRRCPTYQRGRSSAAQPLRPGPPVGSLLLRALQSEERRDRAHQTDKAGGDAVHLRAAFCHGRARSLRAGEVRARGSPHTSWRSRVAGSCAAGAPASSPAFGSPQTPWDSSQASLTPGSTTVDMPTKA
jgi:hypothetical protein